METWQSKKDNEKSAARVLALAMSDPLPARLFLNNIIWTANRAELFQALQAHGLDKGVQEIHICRKGMGYPDKRCCAFVVYDEMRAVLKAVETLDGKSIPGICKDPLRAELAQPRRAWVQ